jgi:hypothetical protein
MMQEMMKQCCTEESKPDFEKMKQFMVNRPGFSGDSFA